MTPKPIKLTVMMKGAAHTLTVTPGAEPRLASVEGAVKEKLKRATDSLQDAEPQTEAEMDSLIEINDLNDALTRASNDLKATPTAENEKKFEQAALALKKALQRYAGTYKRPDIEAIAHEVTIAQAMKYARHTAPRDYGGKPHRRRSLEEQWWRQA